MLSHPLCDSQNVVTSSGTNLGSDQHSANERRQTNLAGFGCGEDNARCILTFAFENRFESFRAFIDVCSPSCLRE